MNLTEVKERAKKVGINPRKMKKAQIIQAIQIQENNVPCFGTATDYCDQTECLWRKDCLRLK